MNAAAVPAVSSSAASSAVAANPRRRHILRRICPWSSFVTFDRIMFGLLVSR
jgi:hypothetical protein